MKYKRAITVLIICLQVLSCMALEYTWTAGGDGVSLYQEKNWEYNGQNPDRIDPGVPITFDLLVNSGTVGGGGFNGNLLLGGHSLTMTGGQVVGQNNSGIMSFDPSNDTKSEIIMTGGLLRCYFIRDVNVHLRNNASVELLGITDALDGSTFTIDPEFTGVIFLKNVGVEYVRENYLTQLKVGGEEAIENQNIYLSIKEYGTQLSLQKQEDELPLGNKDYSDSPQPNDGPNIIFILLDDMGYGDLGKFWQNQRSVDNKMLSPVLDKLAEEGTMMTQHYCAAPVCAPARASLLEGLNQGHASVRNNQFDKAIKKGLGMAGMLQKAGYRTMHVGKYGLAGGRNSDLEGHPLARGFDQFFGYLFHNQGHIHYPQDGTTTKQAYFTDGSTPILEGTMLTYTTDVFTAKSKQWIIDHQNERPEQPFFLYLAYDVPHSALDVPTVAYPEGRGVRGGVQWTGKDSETPWVNTAKGERNAFIHPDYKDKDWPSNEKKFATMMRRVDNACGDLVQTLKDLNIDEHTMIVFSSDNGPHKEGGRDVTFFQSYANMNGIKRDMWEGGIRMATIARYPGVIPENAIDNFPSGHWDWMATFGELAGIDLPAYTDGVSLMPSLKQVEGQHSKGYLYLEYYHNGSTPTYSDFGINQQGRKRNQMQVIRMGNYKGIRYNVTASNDNFEIYDVENDPGESNNLAQSMSYLQQQMKNKVLQVRNVDESANRPYDDALIPGVIIGDKSPGLQKNIYVGKQMWVPDFELLKPVDRAVVANIDVDTGGRDSLFGLFYKGFINIETSGNYTFFLQSSSPCHIKLHEIHLLDNDFTFTNEEISASVHLNEGLHPIRIYYQQNSRVNTVLNLKFSGPGIQKQIIPESMFFYQSNTDLALDKQKQFDEITIFPDPVQNMLHITMGCEKAASFQFLIYNINGMLISKYFRESSSVGRSQRVSLSVKDMAPGIYIVRIQDINSGSENVKRFIKS